MKDSVRAFIAVNLPPEVKEYLGRFSADLAATLPPRCVRWVQPQGIHMTLRFIGETEKNLLPAVGQVLDAVAAQQPPFELHLHGFGCFPNCRRPRVLWTGLAGQVGAAVELKKGIDRGLVALGWDAEARPYRPHLTIGRVKDSRQAARQSWPQTVEPLPIPVSAVHLVESELTPQGPIYTVRHTSRLQGGET